MQIWFLMLIYCRKTYLPRHFFPVLFERAAAGLIVTEHQSVCQQPSPYYKDSTYKMLLTIIDELVFSSQIFLSHCVGILIFRRCCCCGMTLMRHGIHHWWSCCSRSCCNIRRCCCCSKRVGVGVIGRWSWQIGMPHDAATRTVPVQADDRSLITCTKFWTEELVTFVRGKC